MISGAGVAVAFAGVKRDLTDQEGLARRVSRSSGGLALEERGRVVGGFASRMGCSLVDGIFPRQCFGIIAQVLLLRDEVAIAAKSDGLGLEICRADLPLRRAERRTSIP